jgi:hypothetical protein
MNLTPVKSFRAAKEEKVFRHSLDVIKHVFGSNEFLL